MTDVTSTATQNTNETAERLQTSLHEDIEQIVTYIVEEEALGYIQAAFERVRDACLQRVKQKDTEQKIHRLHDAVQQLTTCIETASTSPTSSQQGALASYAAVASRGIPAQQSCIQQSCTDNAGPSTKLVPTRHKHEIIIVRSKETD
jgi:hypothetical protein